MDEGFLGDVLGRLGIPDEVERQPVNVRLMAADELLECDEVAASGPAN